MKTSLLLCIGLFLCLNCYSQINHAPLIGTSETNIVTEIAKDSNYKLISSNRENDTLNKITYQLINEGIYCNFFFKDKICVVMVLYYPITNTPELISIFNTIYKKTEDDNVWVDKEGLFKIQLFLDDKIAQVGYKRL